MFYCLNFRNNDGNVDNLLIETEVDTSTIEEVFDDFKKYSKEKSDSCDIREFLFYLVKKRIAFKRIIPTKLFFTEY